MPGIPVSTTHTITGAIVLTLRHRPGVKKQDIAAQVGRKRSEGVELKDIRPGQGIG